MNADANAFDRAFDRAVSREIRYRRTLARALRREARPRLPQWEGHDAMIDDALSPCTRPSVIHQALGLAPARDRSRPAARFHGVVLVAVAIVLALAALIAL